MSDQRSGIVGVSEVEAAAEAGRDSIVVPSGSMLTPLARERAAELGLDVASEGQPAADPRRKALRAQVEAITARVVARHGGDSDQIEPIVNAVMRQIAGPCPCGDH